MLFSSIIADGENGPLTTVTGRLPYATAKAALLGFTSQLAKDLAEWGITVNALMPGLILGEQGTRIRDRFDRLEPQERAAMLARYPGGKPGSGDDIAAVVDFLLLNGRLHFGCRVAGRRRLPLSRIAVDRGAPSLTSKCRLLSSIECLGTRGIGHGAAQQKGNSSSRDGTWCRGATASGHPIG